MSEQEPTYNLQRTTDQAMQPAHLMHEHTLFSLTSCLQKVKIKLSVQQLRSIAVITQSYIARQQPRGVHELADLLEVYNLSDKLRKKVISATSVTRLSLKMNEARALYNVLDYTEFAEFAKYEAALAFTIIAEIDKQTV
jgi:uncharacterized protein YpbB